MNYLEPFKRGKASSRESVIEILSPLVNLIKKERENLSFSPTQRGWCYLLEGLGACTKGDFLNVQSRITTARKMGLLPLDITAEDDTRSTSGGGYISKDLDELIRMVLEDVPYSYSSSVIEMFTGVHLELFVEKLDLVGMLKNVTQKYSIPVTCSRGWSDLHSRAALLKRCARYKMPTVILLFGDFDVGGLSITDAFETNLEDALTASGLEKMPDMQFERVGLNFEDIENLGLVWIDGLETSSGNDLASPKHKAHNSKPVQDYLANYGARKCEANALLRCPKEAEKILLNAVTTYVSDNELIAYQEQQSRDRKAANNAIARVLEVLCESR